MAGACLVCVQICSGPAVPDSGFTATGLPTPSAPTPDIDASTADTATNAEAAPRQAIVPATPPTKTSRDVTPVTAGPLDSPSKQRLATKLRAEVQKFERLLEERFADPKIPTSTAGFRDDLEIAAKLERSKVEERMARDGTYLTIKDGGEMPHSPTETLVRSMGGFRLENGEWGQAVFVVTPHTYSALGDLYRALDVVYTHSPKEGLDRFLARPFAEQRAWAERFLDLRARFQAGTAEMPADDIAAFLAMRRELQYLDADIHPEWLTMVPRRR